jgi:hypothetical protein
MFLHGRWLRLAGNMLVLRIAGDDVEEKVGSLGFLALYLGTGLAAAFAHVAARAGSSVPAVLASGAISGVVVAYAVLCTYRRVKVVW